MARFFAVNWAVAGILLAITFSTLGTTAYWYNKVYGYVDGERFALEKFAEKNVDGAAYLETSVKEPDLVTVIYSLPKPNHFASLTVFLADKKKDRWAIRDFQRDFVP